MYSDRYGFDPVGLLRIYIATVLDSTLLMDWSTPCYVGFVQERTCTTYAIHYKVDNFL